MVYAHSISPGGSNKLSVVLHFQVITLKNTALQSSASFTMSFRYSAYGLYQLSSSALKESHNTAREAEGKSEERSR